MSLHPRHCTETVTISAYIAPPGAFAGTWAGDPVTWLAQVEGNHQLAVTADGVSVHTVLTVRIPPALVNPDDSSLVDDLDADPGARGLVDRVPVESLVLYRGRPSYVLAVREVLRQGQLVYLEVTTGDRAPLFGGWLVTDAVLERTGGRDPKGNPLPVEDVPVPQAVVRPVSTSDTDRSQDPETTAELVLPLDAPTVTSTDRVRLPSGPMAGRYQVVGDPAPHPTRTVVELRRL